MAGHDIVFGPVPSRRLGQSLGINNIPAKTCSYACVYCQVGGTTRMAVDRLQHFSPEEISAAVRGRIDNVRAGSQAIDFLTFVPDGEPTLDLNLRETIRRLKTLGIPIGVITNSSLLWRGEVRETLAGADWVSVKIDAVEEKVWRKVNRPHQTLHLDTVLKGVAAFADEFDGTLVTETMLVGGVNDHEKSMLGVSDVLAQVNPRVAYLSVPTRPPAVGWVHTPSEANLNRAFQIVSAKVRRAEVLVGYEGNAFACTGDIKRDLLSITAVHPMREEAVEALLAQSDASWQVVERLLASGDLIRTTYNEYAYYIRRFKRLT